MGDNKKKIIFGVGSLLISAILQAVFLCYLQNAWIVLVFTCMYAVVFLKYLKDESVVKWLTGRFAKRILKILGIIILFTGIAFFTQPISQPSEKKMELIAYVFSYICWMLGLLLVDISSE